MNGNNGAMRKTYNKRKRVHGMHYGSEGRASETTSDRTIPILNVRSPRTIIQISDTGETEAELRFVCEFYRELVIAIPAKRKWKLIQFIVSIKFLC